MIEYRNRYWTATSGNYEPWALNNIAVSTYTNCKVFTITCANCPSEISIAATKNEPQSFGKYSFSWSGSNPDTTESYKVQLLIENCLGDSFTASFIIRFKSLAY